MRNMVRSDVRIEQMCLTITTAERGGESILSDCRTEREECLCGVTAGNKIDFIWPGKECLGHFQGIICPGHVA